MATSRKGSWRFFQKHQSFSQWGGVMEKYRSIELRCFLSLWLHSSIREYFLHTAKCDISTFKGTRSSSTPMFISDKGIRKPIRTHTLLPPEWFLTSFFSFSHLLHSYQKQAGLTWREVRGLSLCPVQLTRWVVIALKCIYLSRQWPLNLWWKQWKNEPGLQKQPGFQPSDQRV